MTWAHLLLWGFLGFYIIDNGRRGRCDREAVGRAFGVCSIGAVLMGIVILVWAGEARPATVLPFHLCTISGLAVPFIMGKKKRLLSFMYYLGLPCALLALLIPSMLPSKLEFALSTQFIAMHAIIALSVVWVMSVEGGDVKPSGIFQALAIGNILLIAAYWANKWTNGNYMYLAYAPEGTPLVWFGEPSSPKYIAWLETCALAVMLPLAALRKRAEI